MLNTEMTPFLTSCPKNGSHLTPPLTVTRLLTRHASCPYQPLYQLPTGSFPSPPCSTVVTRPSMRSASPSPSAEPLKIQLPLARELEV